MIPATVMDEKKQGMEDDRRAVAAIAFELLTGRDLMTALDEQYEALSDGCKAELSAICRDLYPHRAERLPRPLLLAAAEYRGKICIKQVRAETQSSATLG